MSFLRYLQKDNPATGRIIKENGDAWNKADWGFLEDISDPIGHVFRKRAFFWSDLSIALSQGQSTYYTFSTSATKHTIIYTRATDAAEGPVALYNLIGATFTPGTPQAIVNLFAGGPAAEMVITAGATDVSGGIAIPVDYLFGSGNKSSVAGSAGLATVFPPNSSLVLQVESQATGSNQVRLAIAFAEFEIPSDLV